MKTVFEITNRNIINDILNKREYGVLAICFEEKPYSVPMNFVKIEENIYFHGCKNGKKMKILQNNKFASFSVVESCSLVLSYFSSNDNLACRATQFFKSVIIDGEIEFVNNYDEKVDALSAIMKKLQKEGGYKPLNEDVYTKTIDATAIYKLIPKTTRAKFKLGQHLDKDRFDMIIQNLEKRGDAKDINTVGLMKIFKKNE